MSLDLVLQLVLIVLCVAAAGYDAALRRIPNWLCAITFVIGAGSALLLPGWGALGSQLAHAAIALIAGMVLFRFNVLGGGDAKFYAGVAAWFALDKALWLLTFVTLAGLVLLFVWFGLRRATNKPVRAANGGFDSLPYGIAIGAGAVILSLVSAPPPLATWPFS